MAQSISKSPHIAILRSPGKKEFQVWKGMAILSQQLPHLQQDGYIFHPFSRTVDFPVCFIDEKPKKHASLSGISIDIDSPGLPEDSNESLYLYQIISIKETIQSGTLDKAIAWRRIGTQSSADAIQILEALAEAYPNAAVHLYYGAEIGCFIGASPETFLKVKAGKAKTMALAGTRKTELLDVEPWTQKEEEEQGMVADFIEDALDQAGIKAKISARYTREAAHLSHLCTDFDFEVSRGQSRELINALHPTPAVGGLPQKEALEFIKSSEQEDRGYYTGFYGPVRADGDLELYVNLRGAQVYSNGISAYVGGGITAQSDPQSELAETQAKAGTLSRIIQKL